MRLASDIERRLGDGDVWGDRNRERYSSGSIAPHSGSTARTGSLLVAGHTVTISQAAIVPCTFLLSPSQLSAASAATSGSFLVTTGASCSWTATASVPWISVDAPSSGVGSGSVAYSIPANVSAQGRAGAILVGPASFAVAQAAAPADTDGDGLLDDWETSFDLSPASAAGSDGALGDPDGDGQSNEQEQAAGTHPRGFHTRYLAEGATGTFLDTSVALLNPGAVPSSVLLRFLKEDGVTVSLHRVLPAGTRRYGTSRRADRSRERQLLHRYRVGHARRRRPDNDLGRRIRQPR